MAKLNFDKLAIRELQRQCLHHNVFPMCLGFSLNGKQPRVYAALKPIYDDCLNQLAALSIEQLKQIVDCLPEGYRFMLQPIEEPITDEYLARVAVDCIATEIQDGYWSIADVVKPNPGRSEVISVCPELENLFDNDGLLTINDDFILLDGGIRYGEHLLHYHQFLRRGYSSNPNFNFLGRLARYRNGTNARNKFRIAIDHRRIMRFDDYLPEGEKDTWYGPKFDPDKLNDPYYGGVTVVARIYPSPLDSDYPLVKTEFFWKANKDKCVKTLEIEELSNASQPREGWHINRYVHAEWDMLTKTFRHIDGAAKVYSQDTYQKRLDANMPRNPKSEHYIKLFRIDGRIALDPWLLLVGMFYKGNEMVVEYFDPELFNKRFRPQRVAIGKALGLPYY